MAPTPTPTVPGYTNTIGAGEVWADADWGDGAHVDVTPQGYASRIVWLIAPSFIEKVTVSMTSRASGRAVSFWWEGNNVPGPGGAPVLDPSTYSRGSGEWARYLSVAYLPSAGCYEIRATWRGGGWHFLIAWGT